MHVTVAIFCILDARKPLHELRLLLTYLLTYRNDMVPIVLGAYKEDYENALPPHSYINVDDFKSIRQLTDYLTYLNKNDTAYASYFAWKESGKIVVRYLSILTSLAPLLCLFLISFFILAL